MIAYMCFRSPGCDKEFKVLSMVKSTEGLFKLLNLYLFWSYERESPSPVLQSRPSLCRPAVSRICLSASKKKSSKDLSGSPLIPSQSVGGCFHQRVWGSNTYFKDSMASQTSIFLISQYFLRLKQFPPGLHCCKEYKTYILRYFCYLPRILVFCTEMQPKKKTWI